MKEWKKKWNKNGKKANTERNVVIVLCLNIAFSQEEKMSSSLNEFA